MYCHQILERNTLRNEVPGLSYLSLTGNTDQVLSVTDNVCKVLSKTDTSISSVSCQWGVDVPKYYRDSSFTRFYCVIDRNRRLLHYPTSHHHIVDDSNVHYPLFLRTIVMDSKELPTEVTSRKHRKLYLYYLLCCLKCRKCNVSIKQNSHDGVVPVVNSRTLSCLDRNLTLPNR